MKTQRLLELALRGLEAERARINEELATLRRQLHGRPSPAPVQRTSPNGGRPMTMAQRRKISAAMKARWAERKAA